MDPGAEGHRLAAISDLQGRMDDGADHGAEDAMRGRRMYRLRGEDEKADAALKALCAIQLDSGLFPAATVEKLSTGIYLADGTPWEYSNEPHIASAAWFILAVHGFNPYVFD